MGQRLCGKDKTPQPGGREVFGLVRTSQAENDLAPSGIPVKRVEAGIHGLEEELPVSEAQAALE